VVLLALPQTFMNASGEAVRALCQKHDVDPRELCVVVDEIALPLGTLRMRARGSAGGGAFFLAVLMTFGASLIMLGAAPHLVGFVGVLVVLTVVNAAGALADLLAQSLLQLSVPGHLRGRAGGAWVVAIGLAPLGQLQIGALASLFGVRRQAVDQWLERGVPSERQEKVQTLIAICDLLERKLKPGRLAGVARRPADAYGGKTMLELIAADQHRELLELVRDSFDWATAA